jgi:hypothetical protein
MTDVVPLTLVDSEQLPDTVERYRQRLREAIRALNAKLDALTGASGGYLVVALTAGVYNATQTDGHHVLLCDCSGGNITINLPALASNTAQFEIKKTDSSANTVTVDGSGAETIDGGATATILAQNASISLVAATASNWAVI